MLVLAYPRAINGMTSLLHSRLVLMLLLLLYKALITCGFRSAPRPVEVASAGR